MSKIERKKAVNKDIGLYSALEAVRLSEGGQILVTSLKSDIVAAIESIRTGYIKLSHSELIAQCAKLSERLNMFRSLERATKNKKLAISELDIILKEPDEE